MKILEINKLYYPWIGGVEKAVEDIAEGLNGKEGVECEVLCSVPKGKSITEEINGVKVYKAGSLGIVSSMPVSFSFFSVFKRINSDFDILLFHYPFPLAVICAWIFKSKKPYFVYYHSDIVRQSFFKKILFPFDRMFLAGAEKIFVSNPAIVNNSGLLALFKDKCDTLSYGVDEREFAMDEKREKRIADIRNKYGKVFVLFVGRLVYYKGIQYLVEAMRHVKENLVIIGEGPLKEDILKIIEDYDLRDKVFILSPLERSKLIDFYFASSLFVLPSIYKSEAFGIVLIEAMAAGKPVVSTELHTGTSYVNQNNVTGLVVPPKDIKALEEAVNEILNNEEVRESFSEAAKNRVAKYFSRQIMTDKLISEFKKAYNKSTL